MAAANQSVSRSVMLGMLRGDQPDSFAPDFPQIHREHVLTGEAEESYSIVRIDSRGPVTRASKHGHTQAPKSSSEASLYRQTSAIHMVRAQVYLSRSR